MGYNFDATSSPQRLYNPNHTLSRTHHHNPRAVHLFDPEHPQCPNPSLMPHFIQLFFEQMGGEFPFISYDEILAQFFAQTLSPLLSNCIASLAVRYANLPLLIAST